MMNKNSISPSSPSSNDAPPAVPTRQEKVAAIKQAIKAGTYHVDDRALADSLLRELLWEQWERLRFLKP
jgi:flagellar biosynthesis anti-sigma factor FlgM